MINFVDMEINATERAETAKAFFREGYNCTQAVVLAFADVIGIDEDRLASLATGLGGGVGRMREVCGTVSGMAMVAGFFSEGTDRRSRKTACYATVQTLAEQFRKDNGSIVCRDLLGLKAEQAHNPAASERTEHFYRTRPCERLVGYAAGLLAQELAVRVSPSSNENP